MNNVTKTYLIKEIEEVNIANNQGYSSYSFTSVSNILAKAITKVDEDNIRIHDLCMDMITELASKGVDTTKFKERMKIFF